MHRQEVDGICFNSREELRQAEIKRAYFPGFRLKPVDLAVSQKELIRHTVLSERHICRQNPFVLAFEGSRPDHDFRNAVPSGFRAHASHVQSAEPGLCRANNMEFISLPIPDRGVPASMRETEEVVRCISAAIADRKAVAIHCRAGIGRSSLVAVCVLVLNGYDPDFAFATIAKVRGVEVPDTDLQRDWVSTFQATVR